MSKTHKHSKPDKTAIQKSAISGLRHMKEFVPRDVAEAFCGDHPRVLFARSCGGGGGSCGSCREGSRRHILGSKYRADERC
jgi:hypothetical protein